MSKLKKIAYVTKDCVACGSCLKVCALDAIKIYKGMFAVIDDERCVGCGKCVKICPASIVQCKEVEVHEEALV